MGSGFIEELEGGDKLSRRLVAWGGGAGRAGGGGHRGLIGWVSGQHCLLVCGAEVVFTEEGVFEGVAVHDMAV